MTDHRNIHTQKSPDKPLNSAGTLRSSALNGSIWTLVGFGSAQIVRLISNVALAALLFPEAFALMAVVSTVLAGVGMLTDIGLGPNIVQSKRGDNPDFLNTAWTVQVLRGAFLAALVTCMAWPVAAFYAGNDPLAWELIGIMPVVGLGVLFDAFQSTKMKTASRHLSLGRITVIQLASQFVGTVAMVLIAWQTRSLYSMAIGGVVSGIFLSMLSHLALPGISNRFRWEKESLLEILHFGKWIVLSTIVAFVALQVDKLVFAKVFSLAEVGVYSISASLAFMPMVLIGKLQLSVIFPLYSRLLARGESIAAVVQRSKPPILSVGAFLLSLSIACAESFIELAYAPNYKAAGSYIPILAFGAWFSTIGATYGAAFFAVGKPRWVAYVNSLRLTIFCVLLAPAIHWGGFLGAVILAGISDLLKLPFAYAFGRKLGLTNIKCELWFSVYAGATGIGVWWATTSSGIFSTKNTMFVLFVQIVIVTILFIPFLVTAARALYEQKKL